MLLLFYASGTVEGATFGNSCSSSDICTGANQMCDTTCKCASAAIINTDNNGCILKVALDATCVSGEPAAQCTDSLAECKDDGGLKCLCKDGNYNSGSVCKAKVALEVACTDNGVPAGQCTDPLAECRDDSGFKCLCTAANFKGTSGCEARKKPDEACAADQCVANAKCSTKCACNTGYTATPTTNPTSCESSDATIIIAHMYVFIFGIVASLYFLV